jgi:hypothetical protein
MDKRRNRGWIWFFVVLVVLTLAAIIIQLCYNPWQSLTPQKLEDAYQLWREKGPHDYDLTYMTKGSVSGEYFIQVRGGKAIYGTYNGQPLEREQAKYHTMSALFDYIKRFLDMDAEAGIRTSNLAMFDSQDGHLLRYFRRVSGSQQPGSQQHVEITVKNLHPAAVNPGEPSSK